MENAEKLVRGARVHMWAMLLASFATIGMVSCGSPAQTAKTVVDSNELACELLEESMQVAEPDWVKFECTAAHAAKDIVGAPPKKFIVRVPRAKAQAFAAARWCPQGQAK